MPEHPTAPAHALRGRITPSRGQAALWVWLCNVLLASLIGLTYLRDLPPAGSVKVWLFLHLGLLSSSVTLTALPGLSFWLLTRTRLSDRVLGGLQAVLWMLFHIGLLIDTSIYNLFRYHFNASAWNLLTTGGSEDSYRLGPKIWVAGFGIAFVLVALETLAWRLFLEPGRREPTPVRRRRPRLLRPAMMCFAGLLVAIGIEKSIYAQADLENDHQVTFLSQVFPMYAHLRVKELLPEDLKARFGDNMPRVALRDENRPLRYPIASPELDPEGPRPNVLVVVIDSWRADMLDPQVTPELDRFADQARVFENHLSGGNATRFGLFSLLYGLHGTYWWSALEARQPSVLTRVLEREGYDLRVYSSASMEYPEFRSTAWVDIPECVEDDFPQVRQSVRDEAIAARCMEVWKERRESGDPAPFFNFVLLDSAHQTYDFPADSAPFEPYAEDLDYLAMAASRDPGLARLVRHRYQNALHHADRVAARLIADLRAAGELDDTLVIVTGDHGEEFVEHGYWGHTGNFTAEQAAVPFLMRGPGVENGRETRPTAHVDFLPTLLELLGADPAGRGDYCLGLNLLDPPERRDRAVSGWEDLGLWTESGIFRLPQDPKERHLMGLFTYDWELAARPELAFALHAQALERLGEECSRFLAPAKLVAYRRIR